MRFYKTTVTWQAYILIQQLQDLKHFPLKAKEGKTYVEMSRRRETLPEELLFWETFLNCTSDP